MDPEETVFERALRRIRENEARILQQRALIDRLEQLRQEHLLPEARRILTMMESNQRLFSEQLRVFNQDPPGKA
ncbi:hypothetical protein SAMN02745194_00826 [Roseomonas rosea]|uniref:Uncharacterized protein n=1 Tax=Muricoccus roseus TaxID=198092 RepID=A0A1M6D5L6_9PROT|nr:hypothetical protein [Roseomonas rosea]SHI68509.1 hypothetical protein SAMN02745194_00826 [Roseomonas rosea]